GEGQPQAGEIGHVQAAEAAGLEDALDIAHAEPGHAQEHFAVGAVHIHWEGLRMTQRPGQLGVEREVEIGLAGIGDFLHPEPVETQQPIGLVEAVLTDQRRGGGRQQRRGRGDG
ncbi:hypothetical protein RZS08_04200, partial [Arthrospira platensis SPKY1]|nr:hypothetical protein [Arthrospira platensis SPKY1]